MRTQALLLFIFCALCSLLPARAQADEAPLLAFLNSSGQLIVASADGATRWIVSNPGEVIDDMLGFSWSPDGMLLFFAVQQADDRVSLRIGDPATQTSAEVGNVVKPVSGGEWVGDAVRVVDATTDARYSLDGVSQRQPAVAELLSPFAVGAAYLPPVSSFADSSTAAFVEGYGLLAPDGTSFDLGIDNSRYAPRSGLWSEVAPLVAFWGDVTETGAQALAVANAETGALVVLTGSSGTPLQPILWLENSTTLLYRDPNSQLRAADLACLLADCVLNPLETGTVFLPASANDAQQLTDGRVVFRAGEQLLAVDPACLADDTFTGSAVLLVDQVAPRTFFDVVGSSIAVTVYANSPTNPEDRRALVFDAACPPEEPCAPFAVPNAVSGLLSPDERYLVAEVLDDGLYIVSVTDGSRVYLTGTSAEADLLQTTRWNG